MGQEITKTHYTKKDEEIFLEKLKEETLILKQGIKSGSFDPGKKIYCGLEIEGWLTDSQFFPSASSVPFLKELSHPLIVPEVSQFNFEMNTPPICIEKDFLSNYHLQVKELWKRCQEAAQKIDKKALMIGSLPTITKDHLIEEYIHPSRRYHALNERIKSLRDNKKNYIEIKGAETLEASFNSIMLEAAATSMQIHLQVTPQNAKRVFNAAMILSPFMSVLAANSPFLFGKNLWSDTRIPIFEKSINFLPSQFKEKRVGFGKGYIKNCVSEFFQENLDSFAPLLPELINSKPEKLDHLRLHNGTVWRWNRPVIGMSPPAHLRIEHRVPSSGPSITDMIANLAFFIGATYALAQEETPLEEIISFEKTKDNFYHISQNGFSSFIHWRNNSCSIKEVLLQELLPKAKSFLEKQEIRSKDLQFYFDQVLTPRVEKEINGSVWQRNFTKKQGREFPLMLKNYFKNQEQDLPIHLWKV